MAVKNPTTWIPGNGKGHVSNVGLLDFQDNLGNLIITNSLNNIVTTPLQVIPEHATIWTASGA